MPFTVAHAMAVLPAVKWHARLRLDPTCLVIGSMAPDFEYFARGELVSRFSHSMVGIATWNIPVTLLLAALWHFLVKDPVMTALPASVARRVAPVFGRPWRERWDLAAVFGLVVSAALGAFTHLVWDGVTHESGMFVRRVPELEQVYGVPGLGEMPLHRIIQHTSTLIGLVVLAVYVALAIRRHPAQAVPPNALRTRVRVVFAACLAVAIALTVFRLRRMNIGDPGSLIAGGISGLLAGTIIASAITRVRSRRG
jgi:hypothetical protein